MSWKQISGPRKAFVMVAAAYTTVIAACVIQTPVIKQLSPSTVTSIETPVKAHMIDGSTIVFPGGVKLQGKRIQGYGLHYALGATSATATHDIGVDSIVGMESFGRDQNVGASVALTLVGMTASAFAIATAAVAVLGSCPTIYADSAGRQLLQAEGFSYSIAPLFEQRDVDRLRLTATPDGRVVLTVKNEALETHYINHMELLEVHHNSSESAVADGAGHPIAIGNGRISATMHDRAGRDVSENVRASDNNLFSTIDSRLASVTTADLNDYIDVAFVAPRGADSVAIIFDMRNSLLNTVLLYDNMLGSPGLRSIEYLSKDLSQISNAVDLGRWYSANMGMHISIRDGDSYRQVGRLGDSGPIAFHRVAALVPVVAGKDDSVHVRLTFVADDWRIDEIAIAGQWRRPSIRTIPVSRVVTRDPAQAAGARAALSNPDTDYLITVPDQSFNAEFDVGPGATDQRTWFVATQGYYTEWVRGSWIKNASGKPFTPTNDALVDAIRGYRVKQSAMELRFNRQLSAAR